MKPETILKKIHEINSIERLMKDNHREQKMMKLFREAINNFDSYTKGDAYWILDGIWGLEQDHKNWAMAYQNLYDELNKKRHEKWGEDCEP